MIDRKIQEILKNVDYNFLFNLTSRWHDEKEYENFEDYKKSILEKFKELNIIKVTKRPVGIVFLIDNKCKVALRILKKGNILKTDVKYSFINVK